MKNTKLKNKEIKKEIKSKNIEIDKVLLTDKFIPKTLILLGFLTMFMVSTHFLVRPLDVSYISLNELVELEKNRLKKEGIMERNLFFGKPTEANDLIQKFQTKETGFRKIVFLSQGEVYGDKVKSISKEAYDYVMENLK